MVNTDFMAPFRFIGYIIAAPFQFIYSLIKETWLGSLVNVIWLIIYLIFVAPFLALGEEIFLVFAYIAQMVIDLVTDFGGAIVNLEQILEGVAKDV